MAEPYQKNDLLAGAVIIIDGLLALKWIKDDEIENLKKIRERKFNKIDSPRLRYLLRNNKVKL